MQLFYILVCGAVSRSSDALKSKSRLDVCADSCKEDMGERGFRIAGEGRAFHSAQNGT